MSGKRQRLLLDSSTLIGCEKAGIFSNHSEILCRYFELRIPSEVFEELKKGKSKENARIQKLIKSGVISTLIDEVSGYANKYADKYGLDRADVSGLLLAKKIRHITAD